MLAKEKGKKKKKLIRSRSILGTTNDKRWIETRSLFFLEIKSIGILDVSRATKPTYRRFNFHLVHRHTHTHTPILDQKKKIKNSERNRFLSSGGGRSPISPTRFVARWIVKQRRYLLLPSPLPPLSPFPILRIPPRVRQLDTNRRSRDFRDGTGNTFVIKGNIDLEISADRNFPFHLDNNFYREYREWILCSSP